MKRAFAPSRRSPHLSTTEVRDMVDDLESQEGEARADTITRLAWRPAWAIRSRRGSLQVLREMFGLRRKSESMVDDD
ncbi:MAG: hypothetical protein KTR32_43785 [Granulosicoccus sp.]|nr:hypothetical protein [Granulosicoccus sp.]